MDSSKELISSVLPQSAKNSNFSKKKAASKLSLKKHFRKSLSLEDVSETKYLSIDNSSESSSSSLRKEVENECKMNCTIVISETDDECDDKQQELNLYISPKKKAIVDKWLNSNQPELSAMFSDISAIHGDQKGITKTVSNSTFMCNKTNKIDKYFAKHKEKKLKSDSDNEEMVADNSFTKTEKPINQLCKFVTSNLGASCENILTELYGDQWKSNLTPTPTLNNSKKIKAKTEKKLTKKLQITPNMEISTEPKKNPKFLVARSLTEKKNRTSITYKNPYLDSEREKSNRLLNNLQKARISSKTKLNNRNNRLYDSDDSEIGKENVYQHNLPAKKLFNDSTDEEDSDVSDDESRKRTVRRIKKKTENFKIQQVEGGNKVEDKNMNFLASLSQNVNTNNEGRMYRTTYKTTKNELAKKLFDLYNETVFDKKIATDTKIEWNERMTGTAGFCYCKKITRRLGNVERSVRIVLATKILDSADRLRDTLIHEMCHAAAWVVNEVADGHGYYWKIWTEKAMHIYPLLPPIKRCHDYVINTKYTYKCVNCGYSIGRHSKSLDVEKKRCGVCFGRFEVYLNKTKKNGNAQILVTPKKGLNKFAQFVKDNYGLVRTPERKHKDVMNILSKKFAKITAT